MQKRVLFVATLTPLASSLFACPTAHGRLNCAYERLTPPEQGNGGTYTTGGTVRSTEPRRDPPFVLPLSVGVVIVGLLCGLWFAWQWYDRRARVGERSLAGDVYGFQFQLPDGVGSGAGAGDMRHTWPRERREDLRPGGAGARGRSWRVRVGEREREREWRDEDEGVGDGERTSKRTVGMRVALPKLWEVGINNAARLRLSIDEENGVECDLRKVGYVFPPPPNYEPSN